MDQSASAVVAPIQIKFNRCLCWHAIPQVLDSFLQYILPERHVIPCSVDNIAASCVEATQSMDFENVEVFDEDRRSAVVESEQESEIMDSDDLSSVESLPESGTFTFLPRQSSNKHRGPLPVRRKIAEKPHPVNKWQPGLPDRFPQAIKRTAVTKEMKLENDRRQFMTDFQRVGFLLGYLLHIRFAVLKTKL